MTALQIRNDEELARAHKEATELYERIEKMDALGCDKTAAALRDELHNMLMVLIGVTKLTPEKQRHAINVLREFKAKQESDEKLTDDEHRNLNYQIRTYMAAFLHTIAYQFYTSHEPTILNEQTAN